MNNFTSVSREAEASRRAAEHECDLRRNSAGRYRLVHEDGDTDWWPDEGGTLDMVEDELDLFDQISALPPRPTS